MKNANEVNTGFLATLLNRISTKVPGVNARELSAAFQRLSPEIADLVSQEVAAARREKVARMLQAAEEQSRYKPY